MLGVRTYVRVLGEQRGETRLGTLRRDIECIHRERGIGRRGAFVGGRKEDQDQDQDQDRMGR